MSIETEHAEEIVDVIAPDQSLQSFVIYVRRLPNSPAHLHWEIVDISETRALEATLLSDAPVGLFVVDETGRVLATNAVLNRWIGGDINEPPKQIESFIKNPKALLDSPAQSGRNIRTDTHLITRKGVVTPTLMVGSWSQLLSGDMVASVALYGHSTLTVHKAEQGSDKAEQNFQPVGGESLFAAPVAVLQIEGEYLGTAKIKSANAAFERMSGITDWQDMPFSRIFAPKDGEHHFLKLEAVKCSADRPYASVLRNRKASSLASTGFAKKSIAPSCSACSLVSASSDDVRITTGICCKACSRFIAFMMSKPDTSGIIRSSKITSGFSRRISSIA